MKPGIAVCFPGTGYTCKEALFVRLADLYDQRGYDTIKLDFSHIPFREFESLEEAIAISRRAAHRQLSGVAFEEYEDVVFLSKSLGTVLAALTDRDGEVKPRHLYLTPLYKTLSLIRPDAQIIAMVLGTQDRFLTGKALSEFCDARGFRCCLIDGVNHSLKDEKDAGRTEQINEQILSFCD